MTIVKSQVELLEEDEEEHFSDEENGTNPFYISEEVKNNCSIQRKRWFFGNAGQQNVPLKTWFDLHVGEIEINNDDTEVFFGVFQDSLDWKYGLKIDYVALTPISKKV
eukprot:TRINITY_DN17211_c0_g1_i1.p2 TRINITY_DN17211_c0_g1~~TRINITY_DN17211_c0_g1_i1.p2  ORF type:complete len:108 (+),score=38.13 TRINITY_DN17211_c0_g1_i1:612-935(+)